MDDWKFRDTIGVLIALAVTLFAAASVEGLAQALIVLVGVVIVLLWVGNFFLRGYIDAIESTDPNH